jgi:hypothetical protein
MAKNQRFLAQTRGNLIVTCFFEKNAFLLRIARIAENYNRNIGPWWSRHIFLRLWEVGPDWANFRHSSGCLL